MSERTAFGSQIPIHQNGLLRWLLSMHWLGPGVVLLISAVVYMLLPAFWALENGNLVEHDGIEAFLSARNSYIFAIPFVLAAVLNYYQRTSNVLDRLIAGGTLSKDVKDSLIEIVSQTKCAAWSRVLSALFATTAILIPILFLINGVHPAEVTWLFYSEDKPRALAYYYAFIVHGLAIYILFSWVLLHLRASFVLRRVLREESRFKVNLVILHPDDCMGLGPIGDMVKSAATVLISISFVFFMWQVGSFYSVMTKTGLSPLASLMRGFSDLQAGITTKRQDLPTFGILAAWFAYCFFSPLVFFAPLTSARDRMKINKETTLAQLGAKLVGAENIVEAENIKDTIEMSQHYRLVQQARVWPFNVKTVVSFIATLGTPLLLTILTEIVKKVFLR